jgi:hypothetical protein
MTCYCGIRLSAAMALHREWYNLQGPPHGTNCSNVVEQSQNLGLAPPPAARTAGHATDLSQAEPAHSFIAQPGQL